MRPRIQDLSGPKCGSVTDSRTRAFFLGGTQYLKFPRDRGVNSQQCFVPIAPKVILGPNILVRILDSLVQWGEMLPVLPMLVPEVIRVQRCQYQSWNTHAVSPCESLLRAEDEGVGRQ